jgi:hypothetical protein
VSKLGNVIYILRTDKKIIVHPCAEKQTMSAVSTIMSKASTIIGGALVMVSPTATIQIHQYESGEVLVTCVTLRHARSLSRPL